MTLHLAVHRLPLPPHGEVFEELDAKFQPSGNGMDWKSSMGQDVQKGRRTEIEFMNGYIVAEGRRVGVPTPINAAIVEVVREVQSGQRSQGPENVREVLMRAGMA